MNVMEPDDRQLIPDPSEYYEPYMDWLLEQPGTWNKDILIARFEDGYRFDEFMEEHCAKI